MTFRAGKSAWSVTEDMANSDEFEKFFEAGRTRLLQALYLCVGDWQEAEDLTQEAFVRVWERWDRVKSLEDPSGYLYRVAFNGYRSWRRRASRAARRAFAGNQLRSQEGDQIGIVEARDQIIRALRALPARQRAAVVLLDYLDYSSEEVAKILGVQPATVRVLGSQGRQALRTRLKEPDE